MGPKQRGRCCRRGALWDNQQFCTVQIEDTKPVVEGAGLCSGYTISRAILADTIALIFGDRPFTADFTSHDLAAWGSADCVRSPGNPGFGSMLGRLLLRTLPKEFADNSTYAWSPLMTRDYGRDFDGTGPEGEARL